VKKKAVMLVLATVAIVSLVVVGSPAKPVARAQEGEEQSEPIGTIGEITTELRTMNENFERLIEVMEEEEVFEWTGQAQIGPGNPIYESMQRMCQSMLDASGGRLKLQIIPFGEGGPQGAFDQLNAGVIDFVAVNLAFWKDKFPAGELFSMRAGGMSPMEKYLWFISGGGAELAQQMIGAYNVHLVPGGGQLTTPETFLNSNTKIKVPGDLVDLKIRASGDGAEIFFRMGAKPVFMPGREIYEALQEGWINAAEFASPCLDWTMAFYEVVENVYRSECRAPHNFAPFLVNKTSWEELPDDLKVIMEKISREEAIAGYADLCQGDIEALEWFEDYGCNVETLSVEVEEAFLDAANEFYDQMADADPFYAEVLQSQRDFQATFRDTWSRP